MAITGLALALYTASKPLQSRLQTLTAQSSSGLIGERFGDIAVGARRSLDLSAEIARRDTYATNLARAGAVATTTQTALGRLATIAKDFLSQSTSLLPGDATAVEAVAEQARQALKEVGALLNTRSGETYVFGGSDTANPPVPDAADIDSSGLVTQIRAAVAGLGGGNAASVLATAKAAAQSDAAGTTVFSAFLSDPAAGGSESPRSVPTGDGQSVPYGLFANRNTAVVSDGETTGSWSRDLLRGLATLSGLTADKIGESSDFSTLVGSVTDTFRSAVGALGVEAGVLGDTQARMKTLTTDHAAVTITLKSQLSDLTEVDMAETLTRLQNTQTQLQSSYQVIAKVSGLTLASFL
ncbi:hypothetical protein M0638_01465 [Roseomonas sp. NAR14]|uniref:Flagellin C-terminal domain-containing protein n=1 Tax=Roseomonas acroporae TaxID=2937791 RepID=A0A9X1Y430_9PROT|nr:flagellin [Roseomonas acroporae]MCK8783048.1 hypothetical protein [Roseomonas acroporae]